MSASEFLNIIIGAARFAVDVAELMGAGLLIAFVVGFIKGVE